MPPDGRHRSRTTHVAGNRRGRTAQPGLPARLPHRPGHCQERRLIEELQTKDFWDSTFVIL